MKRVKLRVRMNGVTRSRTVRVAHHRDHGGRGEADEALASFRIELQNGSNAALPVAGRPAWTLRTQMEDYIADRARVGKTRATVESYENVAKRLTDDIANKALPELGSDDFDAFYGVLAARKLSPNTIRQTHAVLSAAMTHAVKKGRVPSNQVLCATPPDAKAEAKARITPAQVQQMIAAAIAPTERGGEGDIVLAMAIFLATYAGGRRGELVGLRWVDYDPTAGLLRYERQWVPGKGGQYLTPLKSATGSLEGVRTIHLGPQTVGVLERYRARQRAELEREPDGWLLSHDGGATPLRAKALTESVASLGRKLGMDVTVHSFRRTTDTQMIAAGIDVDTAARRSGHTREVMLRHYVQGADDKAIAAAAALENRLIDQGLPIGELLAR
jgi:integrase